MSGGQENQIFHVFHRVKLTFDVLAVTAVLAIVEVVG